MNDRLRLVRPSHGGGNQQVPVRVVLNVYSSGVNLPVRMLVKHVESRELFDLFLFYVVFRGLHSRLEEFVLYSIPS